MAATDPVRLRPAKNDLCFPVVAVMPALDFSALDVGVPDGSRGRSVRVIYRLCDGAGRDGARVAVTVFFFFFFFNSANEEAPSRPVHVNRIEQGVRVVGCLVA